MNFLNIFEDRVAGVFGATRAPFSFKKLAKQAAHEMEDQTLVVNGVDTAPALYTILVSPGDDVMLAQYYPQLTNEISELIKAQAEKRRYAFVGEPLVRFMVDPALKPGKFSVFAENVDAPTLGRLYEEERAYLSGSSLSLAGGRGAARAPQRGAQAASSFMPDRSALDPLSPRTVEESFQSVPPTVSREALAGMGGAAATGGIRVEGASQPQVPSIPYAELVDVVSGEHYQLTSARCIVGRERASADIVLSDPNVSRRHAELTFTGSGWTIEDLNSTNGLLVNNRRVTRWPLRNGDLVTFGLMTFEFRG